MLYKKNMCGRLNIKKVMVISGLLVATIASSVYFITKDNYAKYKEYKEENKLVGDVKSFNKEDTHFYMSIFYPSFNISTLDTVVKQIYQKDIDEQKQSKTKDILYMDYQTSNCFNQYISTILDFKRIDTKDQIVVEKQTPFTYDKQQNKVLTIKDIFRSNYQVLLKNKGLEKIDITSTRVTLDNKNIYIYPDDNDLLKKVTIPYQEASQYLLLDNKEANPTMPIDIKTPIVQPTVDPSKPMIAFTLDDGPHKTNTERTISLFEQYNGRATFFMLGNLVERYPDIVKDVYVRGFEIANHSWDHANLPKVDENNVNQEIYNTQNAIYKITGKEPTLFRPPYGAYNSTIKADSQLGGLSIMLWSVDTLDWKTRNAEAVKNAILKDAYDGAVILLHDIHTTSIDGLELALPILKQQGYQFVTVDTLKQYRKVHEW